MMNSTVGWYPDPEGLPLLRLWDGRQWTAATAPMAHQGTVVMAPAPVIVIAGDTRGFFARHPIFTTVMIIVSLALLPVLWWLIASALVTFAIVYLCGVIINNRHERAEALAARAELQHRQYLQGDPQGIYGQYPPDNTQYPAAA